jgi:hypothetical protein
MPASLTVQRVRIHRGAFNRLTRTRTGPVGRDIQRRGLRVTARMKQNASGRPGPNIRTGTLVSAISFLRFSVDIDGIHADIGPQAHRVTKRGWNYAGLLELGNEPHAGRFPFMERALDAARN